MGRQFFLENILLLHAFEIGDFESIKAIQNRSWQLIRYWKFWECALAPGIEEIATQVLYFFIRAASYQASQSQRSESKSFETWAEAVTWRRQWPIKSSVGACLEVEMILTKLVHGLCTRIFNREK